MWGPELMSHRVVAFTLHLALGTSDKAFSSLHLLSL